MTNLFLFKVKITAIAATCALPIFLIGCGYNRVGCANPTLLIGCADPTPIRDVLFKSKPDGAIVQLATGQKCVTPCNLPLPVGKATDMRITKPDCEPREVLARVIPNRDGTTRVFDLYNKTDKNYKNWKILFTKCSDKKA